jgi:phosphonoacetate hydrolase
VAVVTAKDKLREILARGLTGIAFSSEKADQAHLATHGITHVEDVVGCRMPPIYSAEASLFVLEAGAALIEREMADFLYLSLTDYVQHKFEPEAEEALDFYGRIDVQLGRLLRLGARIGATADHGMNAKQKPDGTPNLIYLEDRLNDRFGAVFRVILPITDPYVRHHGALGSFANVYCPNDVSVAEVKDWLLALDGITEVHDRRTAARLLELPEDRIGELVVLSGRTPAHHDLSLLEAGLRSHGGRYEEMVPFLISEPLRAAYAAKARGDLRNFDLFEFTINGCQ